MPYGVNKFMCVYTVFLFLCVIILYDAKYFEVGWNAERFYFILGSHKSVHFPLHTRKGIAISMHALNKTLQIYESSISVFQNEIAFNEDVHTRHVAFASSISLVLRPDSQWRTDDFLLCVQKS